MSTEVSSEVVSLFSDRKFVLSIFVAAFTVIYAITAQRFIMRSRDRRKERKAKLWDSLSRGLSSGALSSVEDIINVYKGIHDLGGDDVSYRAGLAKNLREYLVHVITSRDIKTEESKSIKERVSKIIESIESESPFSDVPAAERNLIIDVQRYVELGDGSSAKEKLTDLAGLIEVRQDFLDKVQASNKWSVPLAVIGLVLTIVFGVISIIK